MERSNIKTKPISCLTPNDPVVIDCASDWKTTAEAASKELIKRAIEVSEKCDYLHISGTRELESLSQGPASVIDGLYKVGIIHTVGHDKECERTIALESIDKQNSNALIEILELDGDMVMTVYDEDNRLYGVFEGLGGKGESMWQIERTCYSTLGLSLTYIDNLWTSIKEGLNEKKIDTLCTYLQKHTRLIHLLVKCLDKNSYPKKNALNTSADELEKRGESVGQFGEGPIDEGVVEAFNESLKEHQKICEDFMPIYEKKNYMGKTNKGSSNNS